MLLLFPVAFGLTLFLNRRLWGPARRIGIVDVPGGRKEHENHTPLIGGVGIFAGFAFCSVLVSFDLSSYRALYAGMGVLLIVGLLDDLHDLGATEKVIVQTFAASLLIWGGGLVIADLGLFPGLGLFELGWLAVPFTIVCVVGLINAVNMLDGLDGLAGSVVLVMLFWLSVIGLEAAEFSALALPVLLASALAGFLVLNFPVPWRRGATVFMGDSGSTMLGFALAWFAIDLVFEQGINVPPVTIAWIMALPVCDTVSLMLRRGLKGQNPMTADREHLHHIFLRAGFSPRTTVCIAVVITFSLGGIGVLGWRLGVPEWAMWLPLLAVFALHWFVVRHAWRTMRLLRRATASEPMEKTG
ncbi:MraY family glycosyltransferase [Halofilum ochraceum]|uniref:MraY family glycosyltransferase n=1 Tax=Halofilum ochraceum TaxID=1611323 RepID=UPI001585E6DB|nr:MraY family glycosyltransferase [Halofilum ochraceum]